MVTYRGALLDVDGTLVDSNDAHAHAWVEALTEEGISVPFAKVRSRIGMGGDKLLPAVAEIAKESPQGQRISKRRQEIFRERYLPTLQATPGAEDLLRHLHNQGLKLVAASSAEKDELDKLLHICGANGLLEAETSSADAAHSKPDPDIIRAALKKIGLPAAEVIMIGDTPYDIEAARKCGVRTIAFRSGGWRDADLIGALAVYDHPADLLAHREAMPLAI